MSYVGWPTKVNKSVLDSTQVTVGEGATKEESLETGKKRSRLTVSHAPKKFNVTMRFNYDKKDENGLSEKDRFWNWYERVLCYSVNEFQFPDLMYGINSERLCWYRITGAVQGAKSGLDQEIQMTWESSYEGLVVYDEPAATPIRIEAVDGCVTVYFDGIPSQEPTTNSFGYLIVNDIEVENSERQIPLTGMRYFGNTQCYMYFDRLEDDKMHGIYFSEISELTDEFFAQAPTEQNNG